jgi:hypothetical protein
LKSQKKVKIKEKEMIMSVRIRQVEEAKEIADIGDLQVMLISVVKEGVENKKSIVEIIASVGSRVVEPLITAIQGMDQVDEEWKQNRLSALNAIALAQAKTLDLLLPAPVVPT